MTTSELLLAFLAALLGACAGPPGSVRPPPVDSATDPLACAGRSRRARETDPKLGVIAVRTRCERDHVIVERRGAAWAERCLVERAHALAIWDATRHDQVSAALHALPAPGPIAASPPNPGPVAGETLAVGQTSCPCPRAGDLRGEHCWDHPCDPSPPAEAPPTSEDSQAHETTGPFAPRCATVLH